MKAKSAGTSALYLLNDGTYAAAGDCTKGDDGVLRHPNGQYVQMTDDGEPMTMEMVGEMNAKAAAAGKDDDEVQPEAAPSKAE